MADDTGFKEGILTLTKYSMVLIFILAWALAGYQLGLKNELNR